MHKYSENPTQERKSFSERLQECIDNPCQQITKFRLWREKKIDGLGPEYTYKTGFGDALDINGTVDNPEIEKTRLPVCLLIHHPTQTKVCWQRTDNSQASILVVNRPKHKQGNPFEMIPCLDKAFDIIFNDQGYKSAYARAAQPINDVGVRQKKDWRSDLVSWKTRSDSRRPVMIPRLMALWLRLLKWSIPAKYFGEDYPDTGILILSPNELKDLDEEQIQAFDDAHGDAKRKWRFSDILK